MSSTIIGGNLKCYHGIDTADIDEWNTHCSDPEMGHTESGTTLCQDCGVSIVFEGIPYHPITKTGKNIQLRCPGCMETYQEKFNTSNNFVKVVENPEQGITMSEPNSTNIKGNIVSPTNEEDEEPVQDEEYKEQFMNNETPQKGNVTSRGKVL